MKKLLVTGTDTNVGKTWVTCLLLRHLRLQGVRVGAYKPVCTGATPGRDGPEWEDVRALHSAIGGSASIEQICPQRFLSAVAPNVAARHEGATVDDALLRCGADRWAGACDCLIIEGAGGLLCPLSDQSTVLDLAKDLSVTVLIVAANRLGVINHTLLTHRAADHHGLPVAGIVLNDICGNNDGDPSHDSNAEQICEQLTDVRLLSCRYNGTDLLGPDHRPVSAVRLFETVMPGR